MKGASLLVAVSGGGDSLALLYILASFSKEFGLKLAIAHINHGARSESDSDEKFVHDVSKKLGLPFIGARIIPPKKEFEQRTREIRYAFLREELRKIKSKKKFIAAAHTTDDQAETVLLNLLRGAGVRGLAGMAELEGDIYRPLLTAERTDLRNYLRAKKIKWREDATNKDVRFVRNKIRHQLLPYLKKYNPNIVETLSRIAADMRSAESILEQESSRALQSVKVKRGVLDRKRFIAFPEPVQKEVLRSAIKELKGDTRDIEQVHLNKAIEVIKSSHSPRTVEFPHSLKLEKSRDKLTLSVF